LAHELLCKQGEIVTTKINVFINMEEVIGANKKLGKNLIE
jgi:hypothetical protein